MSKQDYYQTLGVAKNANKDDLKKAFRKLAMQHHPDRNPNDKNAEKKFKEINEAHDVLKDDDKRAAYDRYGHSAFQNGNTSSSSRGSSGFEQSANFEDISDIFGGIFNEFMGGRGQTRHQDVGKGSDLRYNLDISLEEAFNGTKKDIQYKTAAKCGDCNGTGSQNPNASVDCTICKGSGKVRSQQGFFTVERTCNGCNGSGKTIKDPCKTCNGHGRIVKEKNISVTIPKGVEEGTRIRVASEGEAGLRGASAGDLYIFVSIKKHKLFERDGANLYCIYPIKMSTATLGGTIEVPTLDGKAAKITIPSGTQSNSQFRLKDKGMPIMKSASFGDLMVKVIVEIPVKLSKRQKELLEEFDKNCAKESNPETEGFFSQVKAFWDDFKK